MNVLFLHRSNLGGIFRDWPREEFLGPEWIYLRATGIVGPLACLCSFLLSLEPQEPAMPNFIDIWKSQAGFESPFTFC